jgi:hypothetical protein
VRVVRLVQRHGLGVVVDGHVDGAADRPLDAEEAPPPPAKLSTTSSSKGRR